MKQAFSEVEILELRKKHAKELMDILEGEKFDLKERKIMEIVAPNNQSVLSTEIERINTLELINEDYLSDYLDGSEVDDKNLFYSFVPYGNHENSIYKLARVPLITPSIMVIGGCGFNKYSNQRRTWLRETGTALDYCNLDYQYFKAEGELDYSDVILAQKKKIK